MVSPIAENPLSAPENRLVGLLEKSGLPGDKNDHVWIARRLREYAARAAAENQVEYLADLFLTSLLLERGLDPAGLPELQGARFPEAALKAVPPLLKIGCPALSSKLVEKGVLTYEGRVWGGEGRWVIQGQKLKPLTAEWHEMGEEMIFQHIARGLVPLTRPPHGIPQIKLQGLDRDTGRKWIRGLRSCLERLGGNPLPHLMLDV
ncbi:MAG: hypothetical protein ACO3N7_09170 [Kiritimatiellia bacterium]